MSVGAIAAAVVAGVLGLGVGVANNRARGKPAFPRQSVVIRAAYVVIALIFVVVGLWLISLGHD